MMYHLFSDGRNTARSVFPSPSKSAGTALSPGKPQPCTFTPPPDFSTYHLPSFGRKTEISDRPSPSKSGFREGVVELTCTSCKVIVYAPPSAATDESTKSQ